MTKIFDTLTASHLLDENLKENGLKYLTKLYFNHDVVEYEDAIKYGTDSQEFYEYATSDAINTYDLFKKFSPEIEQQGLHHLAYDIEMPFQYALMELAINGIGADRERAEQMYYEVRHLYYEIENELLETFGGEYITSITPRSRKVSCVPSINFNSSAQVVPLVEGLGFKIWEKTKTGKSWNKQVKSRLTGKHPTIDLLIKLGKIEKILNGFLIPFEKFVEADGRIRCSFHNSVAVTGRLTCSSPNIEQLPKNNDICNIRNLFISGADKVFIVADYSGQELRILGEESKDKNLISAFKNGLDLHQITADASGVIRDDAKVINFGIAYGKGAYGFSKDFNCSEKEAQTIIDKFFKQYPGVRARIERCHQQVSLKGYVVNMSGRKRRFPDFKKQNKWGKARCYRQSFNYLIQSYGADVMKKACSEIVKDKNLKICNIVHDEVVCECHKDYIETGIKYIKQCMIEALPMSIPWEVDVGVAERYGETK